MGEFRSSFDYFLWLNAHEEASFQECLSEYCQEHPQAELPEARAKLQKGLATLLESGNIGLYTERWGRPGARRDLKLDEARNAVGDPRNWESLEATEWFHYICIVEDWAPI